MMVKRLLRKLRYLTVYEIKIIKVSYAEAFLLLGEAFQVDSIFDFGKFHTKKRINFLICILPK